MHVFSVAGRSPQSALHQSILIKAEVMAQLMKQRHTHFFAEDIEVAFGHGENVIEKENYLWRLRDLFLVGKLRSHKQTQSVRLNAVRLLRDIGNMLKRHRQLAGWFAQRFRQRRDCHLDFCKGYSLQG